MFGQSLLSAFGSAACTTDTDQLFATDVQTTSVATYQFNNATTSIPSNAYPGTPSNITYAAGKFGNAAEFNGSSSYITASNPFSGQSGAGQTYSISLWFKADSFAKQYPTLFKGKSTGETPPYVWTDGSIIRFHGYRYGDATVSLNTGQWYHLVVIEDNSVLSGYLDGTSITFANQQVWNQTNGANFLIGGDPGSSSYYFDGLIDQLRIFNSVLPQSAVTALYNETTTTATYPYVDYVGANPNSVAYYKMSDATDQLGNYNGTATNVNFNTVGKFGFAGAFNGSSSRIIINNNLDTASTKAISLWANVNDFNERWAFQQGDGQGVENYIRFYNTDDIQVRIGNVTQTFSGYSANTWYHIVAQTNASGNANVWIDGVEVGTSTAPSQLTVDNTTIGARYNNGAYQYYFNGKIDQIRIYDSALSAENVTSLYNEIECPAVAVTNAFNTVLYTGNGGTQAVTGVGFKPDFTWIKQRTDTFFHILQDSVRGAGKTLFSNATNAESGNANDLISSFDTNGFTVNTNYNGTTNNDSTNKNNFTYVAWNWKAPLANLSTGFNGSSSYIETSLTSNLTTFSWSCWIKPDIAWSGDVSVIVKGFYTSPTNTNYAYLGYTGGDFRFQLRDNITTNHISSSVTPAVGQWSHILATVSGGTSLNIYVNGALTGSGANSRTISNTNPINFGGAASVFSPFDGSIDQIRVFNSILSASEISDLYAEPLESNNTLNYPAGAGCIAAYPLQTDAVDLSGNYSGASSNVTFGQPGYLTGNTDGTIPSTVAANVDAGFSIVSYTGNGSNGSFGHGLSQTPELTIIKRRSATEDWFVLYDTTNAPPKYMKLNAISAGGTSSAVFPSPATSSIVNVGTNSGTNASGSTYIAYCFTSIPGYSKVGSYQGSTNNVSVTTLFQPTFILVKNTTSLGNWTLWDNKRGGTDFLQPNNNGSEASGRTVTFDSNGFTVDTNGGVNSNSNGDTFIYMAIA